jgi:predicted DNA-binding protein with PD1-like motif
MKCLAISKEKFVLIFDKGDEVEAELIRVAREANLRSGHFAAIGAFEHCVLGYFDKEINDYRRNLIDEQVEVMSLIGNIARTADGEPKLHAHVVVGKRDGSAHGGHLIEAHVWPALEMIFESSATELVRKTDQETGLPLIHIESDFSKG